MKDLDHARQVADAIRPQWPLKAAEIDRAIAEAEAGKRDSINLNVGIRFKLEKFAADAPPGTPPYEVIEGEG
ncbi:MAG: hypothetical protein GEU95_01235 [Rhizobiales bacterium]|nr:hypothetical protein [Hyphomicrobiales bacterium]